MPLTLAQLKKMQWAGEYRDGSGSRMGHPEDDYVSTGCPLCGADKLDGHKKSCALAAEIRRLSGEAKPGATPKERERRSPDADK